MRASGLMALRRAVERGSRRGQMALSMMVGGGTTKQTVRAAYSKVTKHTMECGSTIRHMVSAGTGKKIKECMKETGGRTRCTDKVYGLGTMVVNM